MEAIQYEKVISEYKSKFTELDKAIAARDKVIDDLRKKVTEFRKRYYDIQQENDEHIDHIESLRKMNNDNVKIHNKNMTKLKEEFKDKSETYRIEISELRSNTKVAGDKNTQIVKKLDIARNVIVQLKEKIDEKDVEITNLQHSKPTIKFTSETQTSLADELSHAVVVNKFSNEKKELLDKFTNIQTKINLQIDNLSKSIQNLHQRKPERCIYGWKCTRRFCKYTHHHLYSYVKSRSSKCDENFVPSEYMKEHQENLHENSQEVTQNLHPDKSIGKTPLRQIELKQKEEEEESNSSSPSSPETASTLSSRSSSSSSNSSLSVNSLEREEVGGMSRSNSI